MLALVPFDVVTTTLAVPRVPAGVVHDAVVALLTVNVVQALPPTRMLLAPVKFEPVIVMTSPPATVPEVGDTAVTLGDPLGVGVGVGVVVV